MSRTLSDEHLGRIEEMFRQSLGRELTPEERKYLGLSLVIVSIGELEARNERRKSKAELKRA